MQRKPWSLVGLAVLAVATVVLVVLSFLNVRPVDGAAGPSGAVSVAEAVVTEPSSAEPAPRRSSLANIHAQLAGDRPTKILVLGDATGLDDGVSGETRWVTLWAQELAARRPVTLAVRGSGGEYAAARRLGTGTGVPIEILNASDRPGRIATATADADSLVPEDVDLVILSFGHSEDIAQLAGELDAFRAALPVSAMVLVMAQNPQQGAGAAGQRARVRATLEWAQQNDLPFIDVFEAFREAPEPLVDLLGPDRINPNDRGSEVWRDAVVEALG
ncbi:SGNH/GDSL hydrolase family protein [Granulicoccus sp. GXG6511]|uniref:SGNH/GDSL hydrolase family protein n=1 Tax=Granulicoccus sp. GXG6511 TaxID=3381351 RepID=UPI003D7CFD84